LSKPPKLAVMASAIFPDGAPAFGVIHFQNML
jgi:hypothetical protein